MEEHTDLLPVSPQKRRRRPSVRLGEIGYLAPYHSSSSPLVEAPKRRKAVAVDTASSAEVVSTGGKGGSGGKPPRTRPLEHVASAGKKVLEEEWSVIEPAVALPDDQNNKRATNDATGFASTSLRDHHHSSQQVKPRSVGVTRKVNNKLRSSRVPYGGRMNNGMAAVGKSSKANESEGGTLRPNSVPDAEAPDSPKDDDDDDDDDHRDRILPLDDDPSLAKTTSSDSQELFGSGSKGEDEMPADDSRDVVNSGEEADIANPNSCHNDEMQGAIEDGPGQANGKGGSGLMKQQHVERRQQADSSRDLQAVGAVNNGTIAATAAAAAAAAAATTSFSQRVSLSSGVRGWLHALGLGKYSEIFELNEVDNEVLPLLTMEDLREMGVGAVGARRKMFTAIQDLGQMCGM
jgi:hypothetical protein